MAEERIDPFGFPGLLSLDHIARYHWAGQLTAGKEVLDAACGTGFGSHMLASRAGARVLGVDRNEEAIGTAARRYTHPQVAFRVVDLQQLDNAIPERFDYVVCFETLEHVPDPAKVLQQLAVLLKDGGIFLASVPGECDADRNNPYHLNHFKADDLYRMFNEVFSYIRFFHQDFLLTTSIVPQKPLADDAVSGVVMPAACPRITAAKAESFALHPVAGDGRETLLPDSRLVVASTYPLKGLPSTMAMHSREIWQILNQQMEAQWTHSVALQNHADDLGRCFKDLEYQYKGLDDQYKGLDDQYRGLDHQYRDLNHQYGDLERQFKDLERQFNEVLAWGHHYHALATGNPVAPVKA